MKPPTLGISNRKGKFPEMETIILRMNVVFRKTFSYNSLLGEDALPMAITPHFSDGKPLRDTEAEF